MVLKDKEKHYEQLFLNFADSHVSYSEDISVSDGWTDREPKWLPSEKTLPQLSAWWNGGHSHLTTDKHFTPNRLWMVRLKEWRQTDRLEVEKEARVISCRSAAGEEGRADGGNLPVSDVNKVKLTKTKWKGWTGSSSQYTRIPYVLWLCNAIW